MATTKKTPACKANTKAGKRCKARPLKDAAAVALGAEKGAKGYCRAHHPDLPASARFGSPEQARGAATGVERRYPRIVDVMRERAEASIDYLLEPYFLAVGIVGWNKDGTPIVDKSRQAVEVGRSHTGKVFLTEIADLGAQIQAVEKIIDRIAGKPRQSTEISGPDGGPVEVDGLPEFDGADPDTREAVTALLRARRGPVKAG